MTDYTKLIDAETWAFIDRTNSFYPPETVTYTIEQQRNVYDAMCVAFHAGTPPGVTARTMTIDLPDRSIPIRIYDSVEKPSALILYFHGGGFVVGGLESHDDVCAELSAETGFRVVAVDYRLCPEHAHPAAFDDAMSGWQWVIENFAGPIVLCGDSAGGNLVAAVAHATRGSERTPAGQLLIYPGLGGDRTKGSYVTHSEAPMLTRNEVDFYAQIRAGGIEVSADPTFAPLAATDYSDLPPTVLITAQCDPLSDDGRDYRDAILTAGGKAVWIEEEGLVHGYLRARHSVGRARDSFARIVAAAKALGEGAWPY